MPKKLTLEYINQLAEARGGKCLSDAYINSKAKLTWECAEGHRWETTPGCIKIGTWCPTCAGQAKSTIEEMYKIAKERSGKCLSDTYINTHSKLLWECSKGHQWEAVPSSIKRGSWCPCCANEKRGETQKLDIKEMQHIAKERGGKCLSDTYVNAHTKLLWGCSEEHQWEAEPNGVKRGSWCPYCAGRYQTIKDIQQIGEERGGKCLSNIYVNTKIKLLWECSVGHQWETTLDNIKSGTWCPYCGGSLKLTIEKMQQIAEERGGKCLSDTYVNAHTKLLWECSEEHQWETEPNGVKRGSWCPKCSSGLGERICRTFFEQIFGKRFPKSYPKWLVNESGNQMELDGYCQPLKLAFEHQGQQHYEYISFFQESEENFQKRQLDDEIKKQLCKEHGVVLIDVPELSILLPVDELKGFIEVECKRNNMSLPQDFDTKKINSKNAYITSGSKEALRGLRVIAQERGGKCLSETYVNSQTKLLWECSEGHQWEAEPGNIKFGTWCPYCGGSLQLTIEDMHLIAQERGGKCLSNIYVNVQTKFLWECSVGHQWEAVPNSIRSGSWCPFCADKKRGETLKLDIKEMHQIAKERGGKCLSNIYVDTSTKLLWECAEGHQWEAKPGNVKSGKWCPYCGRSLKLTIEEMQQIAQERDSKCLSDTYINSKTKLLWECPEGHQWEATPDKIKRGRWCPYCASKKFSVT